MEEHEPWLKLPLPYIPHSDYRHEPPKIIFGFGFRWSELIEFAVERELSPPRKELDSSGLLSALIAAIECLNKDCGLDGTDFKMHIHKPFSRSADVVSMLWDNYTMDIPFPDLSLPAIKRMVETWKGRRPVWWISENIDLRKDYRIHFYGYTM
ncbi:hypothetical protein K435DRAFT_775696 [Dendrothele bispora CBS 962.96]|uniref:Uncharacterized protein n=1 Tax=Dendrothele bispora (strain CBS 962.96) TaxID=1314807 RepID=A0A4V4HHC4_DENBC|nr:hypothetical protein K435DRAFT_775696 [Dendrothele bispora CBS 962.96]